MSIESLVKLRVQRKLAPAAVWVVVGDVPAWLEDEPDTVLVKPGHSDFDFRALIGLHVDIFEIGDHRDLLAKVCDAADKAKPRSYGLICLGGISGISQPHELALERIHRMLKCDL